MKLDNAERRIAKLARRSARIVLELRREGHDDTARRFEAVAIECVEQMRKGAL